jgi:hypothetical protein
LAPGWIVPALNEREDCHRGLGFCSEEEFTFQRLEEALAHCVVTGIADGPHAGPNACLFAARSERQERALRPLIKMIDDVVWTSLAEGHVQSIQDHLGSQIGLHRPANDLPREGIQEDG